MAGLNRQHLGKKEETQEGTLKIELAAIFHSSSVSQIRQQKIGANPGCPETGEVHCAQINLIGG